MKKTAFMQWIDGELEKNVDLRREVDLLVNRMKLEQDLVALRERLGLSQREVARRLGTSQPYVAKIESGCIKNLGVKTLVKYALAVGGTVSIRIGSRAGAPRLRKAG